MHLALFRRKCLAAVLQGRPLQRRLVPRAHSCSSSCRPWASTALPGSPHCTPRPAPGRFMALSSHMSHVQTVTSEFLVADDLPPGTHLHLIVLNYILPQQTAQLWSRATTRICADGGANRLYDQIADMLPGLDPELARSSFLPDLIKGDLDSVRPDVQDFYTSRGVPMIDLSSDQETTDLEKCLLFLEGRLRAMSEQHTAAAAAPAATQHQHTHSRAVVAAAAATAAASGNGLGHGAKAIGALNAARAPNGTGAHSSSNGSSFTATHFGSSIDADMSAAAAAAAAGEAQPAASIRGDTSNSTTQQHDLQPHNGRHHHHHHQHTHSHSHNHQQQPPSAADAAAAQQAISGRIVFLDTQQQQEASRPATPQQQQLLQWQQSSVHQSTPSAAAAAGVAAVSAALLEVGETPPPPGASAVTPGSTSSSNGQGVGASPSSSGSSGGGGGGVHEVHASVLGSAEGPAEQPSKRLQQDHVILVLGALGGRLDHTLSNLNTLYCYRHLNMALWGDGNLVRLLRAGRAVIKPARAEGPTCGLVPLARPATASSTGLKWDLDNTHMCFRGLLSTSNIISSDTITVSTDEDLLWITAVEDTIARRRPQQQQQQQQRLQ